MGLYELILLPVKVVFSFFKVTFNYFKALVFRVFWRFYIKLDSGACNATIILIGRYLGALLTYNSDKKNVYIPTISECDLKKQSNKSSKQFEKTRLLYPNLFPQALNLRLDYLDCIISQKLMRSKTIKLLMFLLRVIYIPIHNRTNLMRYFLKKLCNIYPRSGFVGLLTFIIMRTSGGDTLFKWALLYGGKPELEIHSNKDAPDEGSDFDSSYENRSIFLTSPVDNLDLYKYEDIKCDGVHQIIIIGAGFDCRSLKYTSLRSYVWDNMQKQSKVSNNYSLTPVFEVDLKHVQTEKIKTLRDHFSTKNLSFKLQDVIFVPCNLKQDSIKEQLLKFGVKPLVPTVILIEGVTFYLPQEIIAKTFIELRQLIFPVESQNRNLEACQDSFKPRVLLCFDYCDEKTFEYFNNNENSSILKEMFKQINLPTCMNHTSLISTLKSWGWDLIKSWGEEEFSKILYLNGLIRNREDYDLPFHIALCEAIH